MTPARASMAFMAASLLAACAAAPTAESPNYGLPNVEYPAPAATPAEPLVEPPEAAEPPRTPTQPSPQKPAPALPPPQPTPAPSAPSPAPPAVVVPETPSDDQVAVALVADLAHYATLAGEDLRREINNISQQLARQRSDAHRVRLAMLYTLTRSPQDDQRAIQLLENVTKSNPGSPAIKQLALVIHAQVNERVRAVREEQQKAEAAIQKLEALRVLERNLLRDRLRSGGGGSGGGSGGGGR